MTHRSSSLCSPGHRDHTKVHLPAPKSDTQGQLRTAAQSVDLLRCPPRLRHLRRGQLPSLPPARASCSNDGMNSAEVCRGGVGCPTHAVVAGTYDVSSCRSDVTTPWSDYSIAPSDLTMPRSHRHNTQQYRNINTVQLDMRDQRMKRSAIPTEATAASGQSAACNTSVA